MYQTDFSDVTYVYDDEMVILNRETCSTWICGAPDLSSPKIPNLSSDLCLDSLSSYKAFNTVITLSVNKNTKRVSHEVRTNKFNLGD